MQNRNTEASPSQSINYPVLLISSALTGFIVGLASAAFLRALNWSIQLVWEEIPHALAPNGEIPFYTLLVCASGGLFVGLCQKFLGNHPPLLKETLAEFRKTGRVEYKHLPQGVVTVLISLIFGGSLGPEAGLTDMVGGLVTWLGDVRKQHAYIQRALTSAALGAGLAFLGSPIGGAVLTVESTENERLPRLHRLLPGLVGTCAGFVGFLWLMGKTFGSAFHFPPNVGGQPLDVLLAVPVALVAALGGMTYHWSAHRLPNVFARLGARPVWRGILGGIGLGILGTFLPLTLFSGEHEIERLISGASTLGVGVLVLIGFAKMLATTWCLAAGWKGGNIFPSMFGGAALGLACSLLFPAIHPMVGVAGGMASAAVVVMRQPLAVILILLGILRGETAAVVVAATLVGYGVTLPFFPSQVKNELPE